MSVVEYHDKGLMEQAVGPTDVMLSMNDHMVRQSMVGREKKIADASSLRHFECNSI